MPNGAADRKGDQSGGDAPRSNRPADLSDHHSERASHLRNRLAGLRHFSGAGRSPALDGVDRAAGLDSRDGPAGIRSQERADFRTVALPAASHELPRARGRHGDRRRIEQVSVSDQWKAPLQSHQHGARVDDGVDRPGVGIARSMGQRRVLRISHGVPRRARRQSCGSKRRHVCLHRRVHRTRRRSILVADRADRHSAAQAAERIAFAVHLFHDFRSEDNARLASRPGHVRHSCCAGGGVRPVQAVPHQRRAMVAGRMFPRRSSSRSRVARTTLPVATGSGRSFFRRTP